MTTSKTSKIITLYALSIAFAFVAIDTLIPEVTVPWEYVYPLLAGAGLGGMPLSIIKEALETYKVVKSQKPKPL